MSREALARQADISYRTIERLENDKLKSAPRGHTLPRLAQAMGMDLDELRGEPPELPASPNELLSDLQARTELRLREMGQKVRRYRESFTPKMSRESLAQKAGISFKTIERLENDKLKSWPRGHTIPGLAKAMEIQIEELTGEPDELPASPSERLDHLQDSVDALRAQIDGLQAELGPLLSSQQPAGSKPTNPRACPAARPRAGDDPGHSRPRHQ